MFWCNKCNKKREIIAKTIYEDRSVSLETQCDCSKCYGRKSFGRPDMTRKVPCLDCKYFYLCGQTKGMYKCKRFEKEIVGWRSDDCVKLRNLYQKRKQKYENYLNNKRDI